MYKIAVTGGIGSGKSKVVSLMKVLLNDRVMFFSVDQIVRDLYADHLFQDELEAEFGTCDRKKLSDLAFKSKRFLRDLEDFFNPKIKLRLVKILLDDDDPAVVVEFPLLFEKGWETEFDCVINVIADSQIRIARVIDRDGVDYEKIQAIMSSQRIDQDHTGTNVIDLVNNFDRETDLLRAVERALVHIPSLLELTI